MRIKAFEILNQYKYNNQSEYISDLFHNNDAIKKLKSVDKSLLYKIVYGVVENRILLDFYIKTIAQIKFHQTKEDILNLLRMSCYQIIFLDKIPDYAVVNESVNIAGAKFNKKVSGFINAVLHKIIKQKDKIKFPCKDKNPVKFLSIKYSFPLGLAKYFVSEFGIDSAVKIFEYFLKEPDIYFRVKNKKSLEETTEKLKDNGIKFSQIIGRENVLKVSRTPVNDIIRECPDIYIQDIQSMKAVELLAPKPEDKILDCCCAPGGKSTFIYEKTLNAKNLTAVDNSYRRLLKLKENLKRLKIKDLNIICADVTNTKFLKGTFDKILVDSPCSNLGVISRRVDVKWRITKKDIDYFACLQIEILNSVYRLMKKGSILVYSTCTITDKENNLNIKKFIKSKKDLVLESEHLNLPGIDEGDGGYVCRIQRVK